MKSHFSKTSPSDIGVYIHVPYCLQKCHYCDFVKYGVEELPPIKDYFRLVLEELKQLKLDKSQSVKSLYFGGGTPSLASLEDLKAVVDIVSPYFIETPEITLEINPGTLSLEKFENLRKTGFNRFSLGVQTFNERLLKACGRQHSPEDSLKDLRSLKDLDFDFNMDLLYGLPGQSLSDLKSDLEIIKEFQPPHVSPYNLTLAKGHFFDQNRPNDNIQIEMVDMIEKELSEFNCKRYEISNFAQPGFESQHNQCYWLDQSYYSFGLGAHSYDKDFGAWGRRYWNTAHYEKYEKCIDDPKRPYQGEEVLKLNESVTDYIHTSLRQIKGLSITRFKDKFEESLWLKIESKFLKLEKENLVSKSKDGWALSSEGLKKTNLVFLKLLFTEEDFLRK